MTHKFLFLERQANSSLRNPNFDNRNEKTFANTAATQKFGHCGKRKQNLWHFTPFEISLLALKAIVM
jgi:hypothetical protein